MSDSKGKINKNTSLADNYMERFTIAFETSMKRWETIVYPSLFGVALLATYGFVMMYHLTSDVASLARNVSDLTSSIDKMVSHVDSLSGHVDLIGRKVSEMSNNVQVLTSEINYMGSDINSIATTMMVLTTIDANVASMAESTYKMEQHTAQITYSVGNLNHGINQTIKPMRNMSNMMPW